MRVSSSITVVSWIPAGSVHGLAKVPFTIGLNHYDVRPPAELSDLAVWQREDRFREANQLAAWIEVADGRIVEAGYEGAGGYLGGTTMKVGPAEFTVGGVAEPVIRQEPLVGGRTARFIQTVGGRTGMPFPRLVSKSPYFSWNSSTAWTTLELVLHADGRSEGRLIGASPFPCHSVYDADGQMIEESAFTDFDTWFDSCFGRYTPWGGEERDPLTLVALPAEVPALEQVA
jgi:hypothetical protein